MGGGFDCEFEQQESNDTAIARIEGADAKIGRLKSGTELREGGRYRGKARDS